MKRLTNTTEDLIARHIKGRDKLAEIKKRADDEAAPIKKAMSLVEAELLTRMTDDKEKSKATEAGTCYITTKHSVTMPDRDAFMSYVEQNDAWHLADVRPLKSAIVELVESAGEGVEVELPAGINFSATKEVNVRRA